MGLFVFVAWPAANVHAQAVPQQEEEAEPPAAAAPTAEPPAPAPAPAPAKVEPPPAVPARDLFFRQPNEIAKEGWKATIYGFVEFDGIYDTTRSFNEAEGSGLIQRTYVAVKNADGSQTNYMNQLYHNGRAQFTARNSRIGVKVAAPEFDGMRPSAALEVDFMASPSSGIGAPGNVSEGSFYNNGVFRTRQAWLKFESDYIDLLAGQTYYLFGIQPSFQPCAVEYLGLPNMIFGRTPQIRLSHTFRTDPVNVEIAVGAMRPPQRDSNLPEGQGALKILINGWKGIHTPGSGGTTADPLAIGFSGAYRRFGVDTFMASPITSSTKVTGWGLAADLLLPIIPVTGPKDRGNALTLNGEFTIGAGDGDLINGTNGGSKMPTALPVVAPATTGAPYTANVDNGMVVYDAAGNLRAIKWRTFIAGVQYYLPPSGRAFVSANYTQGNSSNIVTVNADGSNNKTSVITKSQYFDGNFFFDIVPAIRLGLTYHYAVQTYGDGNKPRNQRGMGSFWYFF